MIREGTEVYNVLPVLLFNGVIANTGTRFTVERMIKPEQIIDHNWRSCVATEWIAELLAKDSHGQRARVALRFLQESRPVASET